MDRRAGQRDIMREVMRCGAQKTARLLRQLRDSLHAGSAEMMAETEDENYVQLLTTLYLHGYYQYSFQLLTLMSSVITIAITVLRFSSYLSCHQELSQYLHYTDQGGFL
jgi:hypothetical protein